MSDPKKNSEDLTKSIDALLDEVFSETKVEKSDSGRVKDDAKTTADAALASVPGSEKDEARGAGRPKQISDVPQTDTDGRRASEYDSAITEEDGEKEPEETKQSRQHDQTSGKDNKASPAPRNAPFKKSDGTELTEDDWKAFESFQKAQADKTEKAKQEELRKSEQLKKSEQENLIKSVVDAAVKSATSTLVKENEELRKSARETHELIKAMSEQPRQAKSITGIDALEKSMAPAEKGQESFSKADILDAAFELAKSGKIPSEAVSEIEMTNRCADPSVRQAIEKFLEGKN